MKELIRAVDLHNRRSGEYETAHLYRECDQKNRDDFEQAWKPVLDQRRHEFPSWTAASEGRAQDSHWDWISKTTKASGSLAYETFVVECNGMTQGMMLVDVTQFAKLPSQAGRELVRVELLATAPWNRSKTTPNPVYRGTGTLLLSAAISLSYELSFNGRIGLYSLEQSESWYREQGCFTDGGYDDHHKMQYFEMTDEQAKAFVADTEQTP